MKQHILGNNILPSFLYLSGSKFFERFSYYALRAILVLYLIDSSQGLGWDNATALELYGTFTMLVVVMQLIGGILSDFVLGTRRTLLLGALLMFVGYLLLFFEGNYSVYLSIGLIAFGSGFYIPSHWALIGQLFNEHQYKLDGVIMLTHLFINLGAMLSGILVGFVVASYSWFGGFVLVSLAQVICIVCLSATSKKLPLSSFSKSKNSEITSNTNIIWVAIVFIASIVMALAGDLTLDTFNNSSSLFLKMGSFITTMLALLLFGLWWWFKPVSSALKLIVGGGLFLLAFVVGDSFVDGNHEMFLLFATVYLIAVGLVEALLSPILMSILLQRTSPKYIATTVALLLMIPNVVGFMINAST